MPEPRSASDPDPDPDPGDDGDPTSEAGPEARRVADGGVAGESPFTTVSDAQLTQSERYRRWADAALLTPARIIWEDLRARIGLLIVVLYVLMGTVGVAVVEAPNSGGPARLGAFQSAQYPLGTDSLGQGIMALVVHSTPAMLLMLLSGALFTTVVATVVGTLSGYEGGPIDRALMLVSDIMMSIPGLPLVIVLAIIIEPRNPLLVGVIISVNAWAGLARSIRSQVLTMRENSYVEASRTMGLSTTRIISYDLLPNLMPYITVNFVAAGRRVIFNSVALYFIGALPFSQLNWGVILNMAYRKGAMYYWGGIHWVIAPLLAILVLTVGLILLAQGTERYFNPRIRARHRETTADTAAETDEEADGPSVFP